MIAYLIGQGDGLITSKREPKEYLPHVPLSKRHALLNRYVYSSKGIKLTPGEQIAEREHFEFIKHNLMPLGNVMCYTCTAMAEHRHHVIPLCRGGASTLRNLVGLCVACHRNYDYIAHKGRRIKRAVAHTKMVKNRTQQKIIRSGSLSRFSRILYKPIDKQR